jgi:murein DD-endopeptidase MepM/ murein hydrolase activator NlpD
MRSVYPAQRTKPAPSGWGVLPTLLLLGAAVTVLAITMLWGPERSTAPPEAVFPLPERYTGNYTDDWGAERVQGRHEGTDIFAPAGTPIYSITGGTVVRARGSEDSGWNTLGGYTVMIEAAYDVGPIEEGDLLYYAHMNGPSGPRYGETVEAGQKIGEVGDTGQGPEGTHGRFEPHLHLGWYDGALFGPERPEAASGAMNPFPLLRGIEREEDLRSGSRMRQTGEGT